MGTFTRYMREDGTLIFEKQGPPNQFYENKEYEFSEFDPHTYVLKRVKEKITPGDTEIIVYLKKI